MGESAIVRDADHLTARWFTEALRSGGIPDADVRGVELEPIGVGVGLLGLLFRARLDGSADLPPSVVAKLAAPAAETRAVAQAYRFYEREVGFYRDLAPQVPIATADCHLAMVDADGEWFTLLLEDLGDRATVDQLAGLDGERAAAVVAELARLHAAFWASPALDDTAWLLHTTDPPNPQVLFQQSQLAWPRLLDRFGDLIPAPIQAILPEMPEAALPLLNALGGPPRTLLHGDWRLDNLLLATAPEHPVVTAIDWQICGTGAGAYDLGYFLAQSLDVEVRRAWFDDLLYVYHGQLEAGGVHGYDIERLRRDLGYAALFSLYYPLGSMMVDLANDRAVALVRTMLERSVAAIVDTDALDLFADL